MKDLLVFYADAPYGVNAKVKVKANNLDDAIAKLTVFVNEGWSVKAAYHRQENGYSVRIPNEFLRKTVILGKAVDNAIEKIKNVG